jgi:hypothetical protein
MPTGQRVYARCRLLGSKFHICVGIRIVHSVAGNLQRVFGIAVAHSQTDAMYQQAEKEPNRIFTGPSDYGSLSFKYPKTWSVYEVSDATNGGDYEAIFNPGVIPPESDDQQYALRVTIESTAYEKVVAKYDKFVKKGDLKSSSITLNDQSGTRLDGKFSDDIRGAAVIIKIRDKTVTIRTEADTFLEDYNKLLKTVTFVK